MKSRLEGWKSSKWHYGRKLHSLRSPDDPTLERVYPSDDPAYVQRRVTKYWNQDLKSPDDPVQDGVRSSGIIGGVSQRDVSSELAQATFIE